MKMATPLFPISWRNPWMNLHHYGIALIIFFLGLLISIIAFRFYKMQDIDRAHAEFDRLADLRLFLIQDSLLETLKQLDYLQQFYYASDEVTKKDFQTFVRVSFNFCPNLVALAWLEANEKKSQLSQGFEFADLTHILPIKASQHFPVTYLDTPYPNQPFYINSSDYATFLIFFQNSQRLATTSVSTGIHFFQGRKKQGFLIFKPIFFEGLVNSNGRKGLFGTLIAFSNFEEIVQSMRSRLTPAGINIHIYDVSEKTPELLYQDNTPFLQDPLKLSLQDHVLQKQWARNHILKFGDRKWELQAIPTLAFIHQHQKHHWNYWEVLVVGTLISGIIASYFLALVNQRLLIEQEVQERTNELENINSILQQEIHERQEIEQEMRQNQDYLQRRHEALDYLTKFTISEPQHAIHEVILRTANVMQIDRVGVWFYKVVDQVQVLSSGGFYILSTNTFSNDIEITSLSYPHYFKALENHSPLILPSPYDGELNQELASYLATFHVTSKMDIPILFEGNLLGILSCEETRGHREWQLEDRHFGQAIADIIAIMITESARRKAEKALQVSEERLSFITQSSIDGIVSFNDKGEIISWNVGAERIFGYKEEEVLRKSLRLIIPLDEFFFHDEMSTKPVELKGQHKNGHLFPIEVSHTHWEKGKLHFDTIIFRDMTERKENEKRLIKAMREAKAANEAKNEFLATISHELRTPLNAIIGFNQCLIMGMDGSINEQQEISLKRIEKSSFHLLNLINDILDLAKIEAHRMELEIMPYNIIEIIRSCVEEMQPLAENKNLTLTLNVNQPFVLVEFDKLRIRQVLLNLLSNAIKFTEKGVIKVTLIEHPKTVDIQVTDTGIGLSPHELEKLFFPFSQADSSITRKYGGTGLGLIISKNIIDLHHGKISVDSLKEKGSTFTITLPKKQQNGQ